MARCHGDGNTWLRGCFPCHFVLLSRLRSAGRCLHWNHRDAKACVCACMCVCVCLPLPGSQSETYSAFRKIEAHLRDVSHELELATLVLFSPAAPSMLPEAWTYFTPSTWHGVLTRSVYWGGDSLAHAAWHRVARCSVSFCIPFRLAVQKDFCRVICISSPPECFGIPHWTQRVSNRCRACIHQVS